MTFWQWWLLIGMANLAFDMLWSDFITTIRDCIEDDDLPPAVNSFLICVALVVYILIWPVFFLLDIALAGIWALEKWEDWRRGS